MQNVVNKVRLGRAAVMLGVSTRTLIRWEEKGYLTPYKTPGGQRMYDSQELIELYKRK